MREKIINLIDEYEMRIQLMEEDNKHYGVCSSTAMRSTKCSVYRQVIEDLKGVLEDE